MSYQPEQDQPLGEPFIEHRKPTQWNLLTIALGVATLIGSVGGGAFFIARSGAGYQAMLDGTAQLQASLAVMQSSIVRLEAQTTAAIETIKAGEAHNQETVARAVQVNESRRDVSDAQLMKLIEGLSQRMDALSDRLPARRSDLGDLGGQR